MSTLLSRAPCAKCQRDELICGQRCLSCGTALTLLPIELVYDGRRLQKSPDGSVKPRQKALSVAERRERWREKNKRRAQQNRDRKRAAAGVGGGA
jgi:hypothetical protein